MTAGAAVVAIDGVDGSGKSMLAGRLLERLRADDVGVVLFRVDDFRRAVDWSRTDRSELDLYYDDYYDLPRLDACLRAFLDGAPAVDVPVYDAGGERAGAEQRLSFEGATLALVEGVFVQRMGVVATAAATIYVSATVAEARRRILARDVARGRAAAEVERRITARYFPAQRRYEAERDPLGHAAVVIDNEDPAAPRAQRLLAERLPPPVVRALTSLLIS